MKTTNTKKFITLILCITVFGLLSCKKDFLEAKPSTNLLLLKNISDYQLLLSNTDVFNRNGSLPLAAADEYIAKDYETYLSYLTETTRNSYIWASDLYGSDINISDWNTPYKAIFFANSVLEALPLDEQIGTSEWNRTKGWALFGRAYAYYDLAQNFCATYDESTATTDRGLPLRLKAGIDELQPRSNLKKTYDLIIADLLEAKDLLNNNLSPDRPYEPSKAAAFALLARIHLSMRQYAKAELYADNCLKITNKLIDYNSVNATATTPFAFINDETIYQAVQLNTYTDVITNTTGAYSILPKILISYHENDLRRAVYFVNHANGSVYKRRTYSGRANHFTGLATDELYLIKAECAARKSDSNTAMQYINALLVKRFKTGTFNPLTASTADQALQIVFAERQKELVRRGLRWSDLKRLNKEGANITLERTLNGTTYKLLPNDSKYIFPIPNDEIAYSRLEQNIR